MIINLSDILQEGHNTILQHGFQEEKKNSFYSIIFSRKKIRLYDERSRNAYTSSCHQLEKQRFNRDIFQDTFLSDNFKSKRREEFQYWNIFLIFLLIPFFFFFLYYYIKRGSDELNRKKKKFQKRNRYFGFLYRSSCSYSSLLE